MVMYTCVFKHGQELPVSVLRALGVSNEMQPDNLRCYIGPRDAFTTS